MSLSVDLLSRYAEEFGFGENTGIDLPGEKPGHVPTRQWKERMFHIPWFPGNTVQMAIGQGYLLATPMQLVQLLQLTALQGRAYRPHVIKRIEDDQGRTVMDVTPHMNRHMAIASSTWALIRRGLAGCVNNHGGTGFKCHLPNLAVSGKTSTIQNSQRDDHAAFAAYAPSDDPEIVVAVFIEHGLTGGTIAALISKSVFETWDALRHGAPLPSEPTVDLPAGGG